ncbi:MAG: hypothetical protein COX77_00640 [Candidatus Komeilibacteria bacterium CG_4_10_14_0_2_um_filter_37_10]|uniref:Uncharacterized protein n=1 Tax=Candidatus Komeilibacteria bacterium CG_4_10_14_0_2_um_filter_37_10 TaxID=1974470 RepID=A0A2M7VGC0_9BACT|nr:MAG: hypothetical protein COX77_00640 [Candidatus Komeilibacteria bacterium CG_4_10_14_0_2_um_filter_37_10]
MLVIAILIICIVTLFSYLELFIYVAVQSSNVYVWPLLMLVPLIIFILNPWQYGFKSIIIKSCFIVLVFSFFIYTIPYTWQQTSLILQEENNIDTDQEESVDYPIGMVNHQPSGRAFEMIELTNGTNKIDLDKDGIIDSVFVAKRNNGVSSHTYNTYFFSMQSPSEYSNELKKNISYWNVVTIWKVYKESENDEMYKDYLTSTENAYGSSRAIILIEESNQASTLVIAEKEMSIRTDPNWSFGTPERVGFHFYDLKENNMEDYTSDTYYKYRDTAYTEKKYSNVYKAINEELKTLY